MDDGAVAPSLLREVPRARPIAAIGRRRPVVFALGTHCSGTSLCSHVLRALGADVIDQVGAEDDAVPSGNSDGENAESRIFDLHNRIFEIFDRSCASQAHALAFPVAWWADPRIGEIRHEIVSVLEGHLGTGVFGVADPRAVRLMPLWLQIVRELKLEPKLLFCLRNPRRVADALHEREGLDSALGEYRWLVYTVDFFRYAGALNFCTVEYERWFDEPRANFDKLRQFLGLEWQQGELDLDLLLTSLVDSSRAADELDAPRAALPLVRSAHELAIRADRDPKARERLVEIASQFAVFQQLQTRLQQTLQNASIAAARPPATRSRRGSKTAAARSSAGSNVAAPCISPSSFWLPEHAVPSAWHEHAPFAFWITEAVRPETFVELGVHHGFSYLCFCQAVRRLRLSTRCYGIDTWKGDDHAGFYGEDVFAALSALHQEHYSGFSRLVPSTFDEAAGQFADGTIDLLHIDGRHAYEDVRHDFETWLPRLSERAVVLFHDTNVRERGFGAWRFWRELQSRYPCFEFVHGHGLGVAQVGSRMADRLAGLFDGDPDETAAIEQMYSQLGQRVTLSLASENLCSALAQRDEAVAEERAAAVALRAEIEGQRAVLGALEARATGAEAQLAVSSAQIEKLETAARERVARETAARRETAERHLSEVSELETQIAGLRSELAASRRVGKALLDALRLNPVPAAAAPPDAGRPLRFFRRLRAKFF